MGDGMGWDGEGWLGCLGIGRGIRYSKSLQDLSQGVVITIV